MFLENVKMALGSLRANKLRSLLTMLGIIIGIGSKKLLLIVPFQRDTIHRVPGPMSGTARGTPF